MKSLMYFPISHSPNAMFLTCCFPGNIIPIKHAFASESGIMYLINHTCSVAYQWCLR